MARMDTDASAHSDSIFNRGQAHFFSCTNDACRLRFPVTLHARFNGHCPSCGAAAHYLMDGLAASAREASDAPAAWSHGPPLDLLLDNWRSLFNVGSAMRTADGAGARRVHLCGITATPQNPRIVKTALGAEKSVDWLHHADGTVAARQLRSEGATLWALEAAPGATILFECAPPPQPLVLVAGNELAGIDPGILAVCDRVIQVPMAGIKESLNVAIALSIACYWLRGQTYVAHAAAARAGGG